MQIQRLSTSNQIEQQARVLLEKYEENCLFLSGNLYDHGTNLDRNKVNSGNYKCIISEDTIIAVFVLCVRGNILCQLDFEKTDKNEELRQKLLDLILDECIKECETEHLHIYGILCDFKTLQGLKQRLENKGIWKNASISLEHLYTKNLDRNEKYEVIQLQHVKSRILEAQHFEQYLVLIKQLQSDNDIVEHLNIEQLRAEYLKKCQNGTIFGTVLTDTDAKGNEILLSTASISGITENKLGMVGGVVTDREKKGKGIWKKCYAILNTTICYSFGN